MTTEFLMDLDEGMVEYFRDIANEMISRFGISRAEAVARINERYHDAEISAYPDLMCHEFPEFWSYGLYYYPNESGRLPTGDEDDDEGFDMSALRVRPAPPTEAHHADPPGSSGLMLRLTPSGAMTYS